MSIIRQHTQAATTSALAWTFFEGDSFDVKRIHLVFDAAPTTAENMTVTVDSAAGAAYDGVILSFDPIGKTSVVITDIAGLSFGDKILIEYTNTDGNSITGTADIEVFSGSASGDFSNGSVFLDGIEQINVTALPGGLTGYAEDSAHVTGDKGIELLSVRSDTAASTAGTDGDYAALITDSTGHLHVREPDAASIKAAVEIMDDWDESDRAAVNPIAGQAGIAAAAGAVDALTPRVTLASDDPAVVLLGTIDADTSSISTDASTIAGDTTSIDTKIPAQGTALMAGSLPVTIATDDTMIVALDAAVDVVAGDTTSIDGKTPALGTAVMTGAVPVTIATDDTMFTALDAAVDIIAGDTTSMDAKTPALGTATMVGSTPVTIATDDTMFTALDTAVDIVAGDTTSIDGKTPNLGTAVMTGSVPVTIATDDTIFTALDTAVDSIDGKTPALGSAAAAASVPITIATDDPHLGAVGAAADVDGVIHAQLRTIGEAVESAISLPVVSSYTGSAAIAVTTAFSGAFEVDSITLHLSAAGTTSESFTVTLDANDGAAYDTLLFSLNLATGSVTNLVIPKETLGFSRCEAGDQLAIAWPNTEARTYGLRIVTRDL